MMRPGKRYKVMWAVFFLVVLIAGIATPWRQELALWVAVGIGWAICAYISFRQSSK